MSQDASVFDISLTMILMLMYWQEKLLQLSCEDNTESLQMLAMFVDHVESLQTLAKLARNAENLLLFCILPIFLKQEKVLLTRLLHSRAEHFFDKEILFLH